MEIFGGLGFIGGVAGVKAGAGQGPEYHVTGRTTTSIVDVWWVGVTTVAPLKERHASTECGIAKSKSTRLQDKALLHDAFCPPEPRLGFINPSGSSGSAVARDATVGSVAPGHVNKPGAATGVSAASGDGEKAPRGLLDRASQLHVRRVHPPQFFLAQVTRCSAPTAGARTTRLGYVSSATASRLGVNGVLYDCRCWARQGWQRAWPRQRLAKLRVHIEVPLFRH